MNHIEQEKMDNAMRRRRMQSLLLGPNMHEDSTFGLLNHEFPQPKSWYYRARCLMDYIDKAAPLPPGALSLVGDANRMPATEYPDATTFAQDLLNKHKDDKHGYDILTKTPSADQKNVPYYIRPGSVVGKKVHEWVQEVTTAAGVLVRTGIVDDNYLSTGKPKNGRLQYPFYPGMEEDIQPSLLAATYEVIGSITGVRVPDHVAPAIWRVMDHRPFPRESMPVVLTYRA